MSSPGTPPVPPQAGGAPAGGAQPPSAQAQGVNPQAVMEAVQKGLVSLVQTLSQQLNVPPPMIMKAIQTAIAQASSGGAPAPQPATAGVRPTQ